MWKLLNRMPPRRSLAKAPSDDWLGNFLVMAPSLSLFRFEGTDGGAGWREKWKTYSDAEYGGRSSSTIEQSSESTVLWSGRTDTDLDVESAELSPETGKPAIRSGWCAIRADIYQEGFDLHEFHGIRLRVRPDERRYILNLRTGGILGGFDEDLFQVVLPPAPAPGEWCELRVPFSDFELTARGYVQEGKNRAMNLENLQHVGVLLADHKSADFKLEVEEIEAFRFEDEEIERDGVVREMLNLNEEMGYNGA